VRIPYYSQPNVVFNRTGEVLGDANNNNAALIMGNRHRLAAIGDESQACSWPTAATAASATASSASRSAVGTSDVKTKKEGKEGAGKEREGCLDSLYHFSDCLVVRHDSTFSFHTATEYCTRGLMNYMDTKAKCRHLKVLTCKG
jgi:hypothetical protein